MPIYPELDPWSRRPGGLCLEVQQVCPGGMWDRKGSLVSSPKIQHSSVCHGGACSLLCHHFIPWQWGAWAWVNPSPQLLIVQPRQGTEIPKGYFLI